MAPRKKPTIGKAEPAQERWTEYMPLAYLDSHRAPRNSKGHDNERIGRSFDRFDFAEQPALDERTGLMSAGHGRVDVLLERKANGAPPPGGVQARDGDWWVPVQRGWASKNDAEAEAYVITTNRLVEAGGWVPELLLAVAHDHSDDLDALGWSPADLDALAEANHLALDGTPLEPIEEVRGDGSLLALTDITIGDPQQAVHHGEVWRLTMRRKLRAELVIAEVVHEYSVWGPHMDEDRMFLPYAGPWAAFAEPNGKPAEKVMLLVQPDHYIAGHIIDKWRSLKGTAELSS